MYSVDIDNRKKLLVYWLVVVQVPKRIRLAIQHSPHRLLVRTYLNWSQWSHILIQTSIGQMTIAV